MLMFLVAAPLCAQDEIFDTVEGHACFRDLLHKIGWGLAGPTELAAFIIEPGPHADFIPRDYRARNSPPMPLAVVT